jgi:protocatechuate 3,4-dioxygenase, alpha subunit
MLPTPSQTVGPFFNIGLPGNGRSALVAADAPDAVRIEGAVYDGRGEPVDDALVEIWQAARSGRYPHPEDARPELPLDEGFSGFGRCETDAEGRYWFVTVKPGPVRAPGAGMQAPHILVSVFARGLLKRVVTRIYFPDEQAANEADPVLAAVDPDRRSTLVGRSDGGGLLRFDIRLRGDGETVFFDV